MCLSRKVVAHCVLPIDSIVAHPRAQEKHVTRHYSHIVLLSDTGLTAVKLDDRSAEKEKAAVPVEQRRVRVNP